MRTYVMNVMAERHPIVDHFFFFDQLIALVGSSGPSQFTILGSIGSSSVVCSLASFCNSAFSTSSEYSLSIAFAFEEEALEAPSLIVSEPFVSVDTKEADDDDDAATFT